MWSNQPTKLNYILSPNSISDDTLYVQGMSKCEICLMRLPYNSWIVGFRPLQGVVLVWGPTQATQKMVVKVK